MKVNINLIGEINQMKEKGIRPNFSDQARRYGYDRKTVKKIWDNDGKPKRKASSRVSRYDPYLEEISSLMARPPSHRKAYSCICHGSMRVKSTGTTIRSSGIRERRE